MGKTAFVFSGQGAQFPGMGKSLYDESPAAREVFKLADSVRSGTTEQCFNGTEAELMETKNTQPCLFTVEMAAAAALDEAGIKAESCAGFSLGEVAALTYSGAVDLKTGFSLVIKRGELMQAAGEKTPTGMAAVLKLSDEKVEEICAGFKQVYPVNYNCPGQVTCAGAEEEMDAFAEAVKEAGGKARTLKVSGAFHSPFMQEAADGFADVLKEYDIEAPKITLFSNYTGKPYEGDPRELLSKQIISPVRWETIVRGMISDGADKFIELGAGNTLVNLIKRIDDSVLRYTAACGEDIEKIAAEVK